MDKLFDNKKKENEIAISVRNIKKSFRIYPDRSDNIKDFAIHRKRRRYEDREVLKGVSFDIKKGEAVGLIGHNGCGKSTTLKMFARIMYPDSGEIKIHGRVASLIELGAGFHPDMSGRENIYTNASIFGLKRDEIDQRLDDIIAFSELEEFIDNPVRTYSSGMYMRLAFAVAINVNADILLVDEILAVGDATFQNKCLSRLKKLKNDGVTIIIVSHAMGQIEQICDRSIWIHEGLIKGDGNPIEVDNDYLDFMIHMEENRNNAQVKIPQERELPDDAQDDNSLDELEEQECEAEEKSEPVEEKKTRWGNGNVRFANVHLLDANGKIVQTVISGSLIRIDATYKVKAPVENATIGIGLFREDGLQCYGTNTNIDRVKRFDITQDGEITITIPKMGLIEGMYWLDLAIEYGAGLPVDYYTHAVEFQVISAVKDVGVCRMEHSWDFVEDTL